MKNFALKSVSKVDDLRPQRVKNITFENLKKNMKNLVENPFPRV